MCCIEGVSAYGASGQGGVYPEGCLLRGYLPGCLGRHFPPSPHEMATAAVGTHPTRMDSCFSMRYILSFTNVTYLCIKRSHWENEHGSTSLMILAVFKPSSLW